MKKYLFPFVLTVACLILYGRSIGFSFLALDDPVHISDNPYFNPVTLASFKEFWAHTYAELYMPVTFTVWGLIAWLSQTLSGSLRPELFHVLNILTHTLNVVLVYFFIHHLLQSHSISAKEKNQDKKRDQWASFLGACLFAFHPMQSSAVAWVSGFKDLLFTNLALFALLFYLKSQKSVWKPFGFYLATLLAKPSAVILSGNAWLVERTHSKEKRRSSWLLAFWLLSGVIMVIVTTIAQPLPFTPIPFWQRPFIALDSLGFYCCEIFWPAGISIDHGRTPWVVLENAPTGFMILPLLIVGMLTIMKRALPKDFLKALSFFLIALIPVSGFVQFNFQATSSVADYYVYFPMIGLAWALALLVQASWTSATLIKAGSLMAILFIWSWVNLSIWKNDESLFLSLIQKNPHSRIANGGLGMIEKNRGNLAKARDYLMVAVETTLDLKSIVELARVLDQMNRLDEIENKLKRLEADILSGKAYIDSHRRRSDAATAGYLLAKIYAAHGDLQSAVEPLQMALKYTPEDAKIHYNLAKVYEATSNAAEAAVEFRRACELEPANTVFLKSCH